RHGCGPVVTTVRAIVMPPGPRTVQDHSWAAAGPSCQSSQSTKTSSRGASRDGQGHLKDLTPSIYLVPRRASMLPCAGHHLVTILWPLGLSMRVLVVGPS